MTDFEMNRRCFLQTLLVSGAALMTRPGFGEQKPEYPTLAPVIEADRVLNFTWDNIDTYPLTTSLAFLPAQGLVVTGGDDRQMAVWNLENGELLKHFVADDDWIRCLALSADEGIIASLSHNGSLKLWNTADWSVKSTFSKFENGAESISYSPDGKYIAVCGFESYLSVYNVASGNVETELPLPATGNTDVKFSPNGKFLAASGRSGIVRLWDTEHFKKQNDFKTDGRRVRALAFSMDGTLLASGGDGNQIFVWEAATGKNVQTLNTSIGKTFSLIFCGNDILASGDSLNSVRLWNLGDGSEFGRCFGHTGTVAAMYFNLDKGELITGGFDTTVRTWPIMQQ